MKRAATLLALVAMAAALLWSIGRLFALRFERGNVYPAYSTLRTDPLGAKALADSLSLLPNIEVRRNYRPLVRLKPREPVILTYLGLDYKARWEDGELEEFERIVSSGSRAVFAFDRELYRTSRQRLGAATPTPGSTPTPGPTPTPAPLPQNRFARDLPGTVFQDVAEEWGFAFDIAQEDKRTAMKGTAEPTTPAFGKSIAWHSALYFKSLGPEWKVLYTCNNVPVIIERAFGQGTVVLCSDSTFLSNEGLSKEPPGELLAALFAPLPTVIFDEEHLGVTETSNIATLARRMRLDGLVLALGVIAALFVWKQSSSLLPRQSSATSDHDVIGSAANESFINLLHRSVPPGRLLDICVEAWLRARGRLARPEERAHIDAVLRGHRVRSVKDAPMAYRAIAAGLKRR